MRNRFLIALALLATVSCQSDDMPDTTQGDGFLDSGEMRFSTSVSETRAAMTTEDLTDFGIYVEYDGSFRNENVKASNENGSWSTQEAMIYPTWNDEVIITAYSPYSDSSTLFSIQSDQSTEDGVKASDLLMTRWAVTPSTTTDDTNDIYYDQSTGLTAVQFNHTLAKFTLNLTLGEEWASATESPVTKVVISGTKSDATIDFTDGSISATGSEVDITALFLSYGGGNISSVSYEAIIVPQEVSNLIVTVTMSDGLTIPYVIGEATFIGNENHTFALKIGTIHLDCLTFERNASDPKNITHDQDEGIITSILSKFRRCMMTSDGAGNATICYLQDDNSNNYYDGTNADLTGAEGDVMVYFPEFWYKYENVDDDYFRYYFSESSIGGGVHVEASLLGAYKGYAPDTGDENTRELYSRSGVAPTRSVSQGSFIKYSTENRGTGYQIIDYEQHCTIAMMLYAKYLNRNLQDDGCLGSGSASYTSSSTGLTNGLGNVDGVATWVNGLGIEGVYGGINEWIEGVEINSSIWTITNPTENTIRTVTNGSTTNGFIKALALESGDHFDMVPTAVGGSYQTYYADDYYYSNSGRVAYRSYANFFSNGGVSCVRVYYDSSDTVSEVGSRLAFRGTITEAASVEEYKAKLSN